MRNNVEAARTRGMIQETVQLFLQESLAIAADVTLASGLPMVIAFDPSNTARKVIMYTPVVTAVSHKHEIFNIGTGTGVLNVRDPADGSTLAVVNPGGRAEVFWDPKGARWRAFAQLAGDATAAGGSKSTMSVYVPLASVANSQVIGAAVPFDFTLTSVLFRVKTAVTTGAKLATLTARVNGVAVTGGVISLTSANSTPSGATVAGTSITAGNTGSAGQTVDVLASAVTAFAEGDGYVEFGLTNRNLAA